MPITVRCPDCHTKLHAPDRAAGKCLNCPNCGAAVVVPALKPGATDPPVKPRRVAIVEEPEGEPEAPQARPVPVVAAPARDKRPERATEGEDDVLDAGPPLGTNRNAGRTSPILIVIGAIAGLLFLGAVGYGLYPKVFKEAPAPPQWVPPPKGLPHIVTVEPPVSPQPPVSLREFRSERDEFKILMPPDVAVRPPAGGPERNYTSTCSIPGQAASVVVEVEDFVPTSATARTQQYHRLFNQIKTNTTHYENARRGEVQLAGREALEVAADFKDLRLPGKPTRIKRVSRHVITNNRIYSITIALVDSNMTHANRIFDSFEILEPESGKGAVPPSRP